MSRKNELECLNVIKKSFYGIDNTKLLFCNCDLSLFKKIIDSTRENPNNNVFPDFFFDGGIMEHFIVSTSKEDKKGSDYKISENAFEKEKKKFIHDDSEAFLKSERRPGTISSSSIEHTFESSSYDWFLISFKKNFDNHLKSLKNSVKKKEIAIFMIEQQGAPLVVYEENRFSRFYCINEDKNILLYLKDKNPLINYIIFNQAEMVEIIDMSKIDKLIADSKDGLDIRKGRHTDIQILVHIDP